MTVRLPILSTRSAFAILLVLIALLPLGMLLLSQTRISIEDSIDRLAHTGDVQQATRQIDIDILQAEVSLRGYFITREQARRDGFQSNMDETYAGLAALNTLIADKPLQVRRVSDLKALLDRRFTLMRDAAARVASGGPQAGAEALMDEETIAINTAVRATLDLIGAE